MRFVRVAIIRNKEGSAMSPYEGVKRRLDERTGGEKSEEAEEVVGRTSKVEA